MKNPSPGNKLYEVQSGASDSNHQGGPGPAPGDWNMQSHPFWPPPFPGGAGGGMIPPYGPAFVGFPNGRQ